MKFLISMTLLFCFTLQAGKVTPKDSKVTKIDSSGIPRNIKTFTDFEMRGNLMRSFNKFKNKKTGRVAYMGGSVTMRPWRRGIEAWLKTQFPNTKFDFIMAGVGGTPANLGAFRFKADVLKNGPVDLFFLEFAVNGGGVKEMEGIVRQAKGSNPEMDIVMMHFANRSHMNSFNNNKIPEIVKEHEKVAKHYNLASIYLYREIAQRVKDGRITWGNFSRDSVHPDGEGSDMYAACIIDFLTEAWKKPYAKAHQTSKLPSKLDKDCYDNGHFVPYENYKNIKGFTLIKEWSFKDRVINIILPKPLWEAKSPGAEMTIEFSGTAVGIYFMSCKDGGYVEYSVDGTKWQKHHAGNDRKNMPQYLIISDTLKKAKHSLKLRVSAEKPVKTNGHAVRIMQVLAH